MRQVREDGKVVVVSGGGVLGGVAMIGGVGRGGGVWGL